MAQSTAAENWRSPQIILRIRLFSHMEFSALHFLMAQTAEMEPVQIYNAFVIIATVLTTYKLHALVATFRYVI